MHRRLVSVSAMVGLLGITLLGVAGASSSARALPGQPASAELLEKTVARQLGTCVTSTSDCAVTWLGAPTYCQTTYGAPPAPMGVGGCTAAGGVPRPCGDCTGAAHVYCEYDALVLTRCCMYNGLCCRPPGGCTTIGAGCSCVLGGACASTHRSEVFVLHRRSCHHTSTMHAVS